MSTLLRPADVAEGCARAVISNHTYDDLFMMMHNEDIPALEQALNEGADVNMVDEVDPLNPSAN